jgi:hypothetical protein
MPHTLYVELCGRGQIVEVFVYEELEKQITREIMASNEWLECVGGSMFVQPQLPRAFQSPKLPRLTRGSQTKLGTSRQRTVAVISVEWHEPRLWTRTQLNRGDPTLWSKSRRLDKVLPLNLRLRGQNLINALFRHYLPLSPTVFCALLERSVTS